MLDFTENMEIFSIGPFRDMLNFMVEEAPEEMQAFIQSKGLEWIKMKQAAYDKVRKNGAVLGAVTIAPSPEDVIE